MECSRLKGLTKRRAEFPDFWKTAFAAQSAALCDAVAPYNFITYDPEAVLEEKGAECGSWSGVLHCRLKALTPLLVAGERRKRPDESSECRFFNIEGKNVIPGSSIKGVLRSMVEILSFSAMRQVPIGNCSGAS